MKPTITRLSAAVLISSTVLSMIGPTESYAATYEGTVNTSILNVRSSTSTSSAIVGKLTKGTAVQVYSTSNNWAQIEFQGQKRYVSSSYLTLKSTVTKAATAKTYTANATVNMRSAMTTSASIVTTIPKGATVTYMSTHGATGSWFKVTYGGKTGYVAQRYFSQVEGGTVAPQANPTYSTTTNTTMHSSMISTSPTLIAIPKGATVTYISTHGATGSWFKVTYGGKTGYVAQRYFSQVGGGTVAPQANPTHSTTTNTTMHSSMISTSPTLIAIPKGAKVTFLSEHGATGSWAKVTYSGKTGYVAKRNLQPLVTVEPTTMYVKSTSSIFNSMSTSRKVVGTLQIATSVKLISTHGATGSWAKVAAGSLTGYVPMRNLSESQVAEQVTPYYAKQTATMYASTSTRGSVLQTIPVGAKVDQLSAHGATGSWFKVRYANTTGYVAARDFSLTAPKPQVATPYYAQRTVPMFSSMTASRTTLQDIPVGTKVDQLAAHGATGSWFEIRYNNKIGYVAARDFALTAPSTSTEQYGPEREVQVVTDGSPLNIRSRPETGAIIGTLSNQSIVNVKPIVGSNWGLVSFSLNGKVTNGYISLTFTKPYTPPTPGTKETVINHTTYAYPLSSMVSKQRSLSAQSDTHRTAPAYVPKSLITPGKAHEIITIKLQYLKSSASATATNIASLPAQTQIELLETQKIGTTTWQKVKHGSLIGYVNATDTAPTGIINSTELITAQFQYLKSSASASAVNLSSLSANTKLEYLETQKVGVATWYKVKHGTMTGYVNATSNIGSVNVFQTTSMTAHKFGAINPREVVAILGEANQYYSIRYNRPVGFNIRVFDQSWRLATDEEIIRQVSPNSYAAASREYLQFLDLSLSANVSSSTLNKTLVGRGILTGQGQAFIDASRLYNVNEIYLVAHALLETAQGKSPLAIGTLVSSVDGKAVTPRTVYNMYGIGAIDGNAHVKGAERAYKEGWFTPEDAIIGGAKFIGQSYINHPTNKRNTLYKMRFDPNVQSLAETRQYATDIGWATKQTARMYEIYQQLDSYKTFFDVPKFQ
ncbi:hypothetical protein EVJ32_03985 [Exiguobacterium sp. SH5S4]|uniref:SH3 domain-containing protein n=1 Tax=Exiguobacterium sp. SH5S4 TaxID=2510961 RepID=UPI00103C0635|nr:SH3 domain-containing protein [Exiguobacterium sp. SH5S4]TCI26922.1 hypothetical protein EVJ32_03985 [Exiguobacterium sp. SH5S4]